MLKSISFEFLCKSLLLVIGFLQVPLLIELLGTEFYGFWVVLFSILQWAALVDLGVVSGLRNLLPKYIVNKNYNEINSIVISSSIFLLVVVFVIFLIFTPLLSFAPVEFFGLDEEPDWFFSVLFLFVLVFMVYLLLSVIKPLAFITHRPYLVSFTALLPSFYLCAASLFYRNKGFGTGELIQKLLCGYLIFYIIASFIVLFIVFKASPNIFSGPIKFSFSYCKLVLSSSADLFMLQLVAVLSYSVDGFLIASNFDSTAVAEYTSVAKIYAIYPFFIGIIISPLWNKASELIALGDGESVYRMLVKYWLVYLSTIPIMALSPIFIPYILSIWISPGFASSIGLYPFVFFYLIMGGGMITSVVLNAANVIGIQWKLGLVSAILKVAGFSGVVHWLGGGPETLMWYSAALSLPVTIYLFSFLIKKFFSNETIFFRS